jgi:transcription antitermination protein NusB
VGRRTKARECAFQMLYQWEITRVPMDEVVSSFSEVRSTVDETRQMAERLARGAQRQVDEIDAAIAKAVTHWRIDRLAVVDKSILRIATYELMSERQTPAAVVLDEAVDVAKRFGEADSAAFVNGVLDGVCRAVRGPEALAARETKGVARHES